MCPHVHQLYDVLSTQKEDYDTQIIYENYVSSPMSYDTVDTDCHRLISQPPPISDTLIYHGLNKAIDRTERYVFIDIQAASGIRVPKFLSDMDRNNYYFESATKYVQENTCSSKITTTGYLSTLELKQFEKYMTENVTQVTCENGHIKYPSCSNESYRKLDGTCNSLSRPLDGSVGDCMRRLLPPDYKDGISQLRSSIDGSSLPNARLISTNLLGGHEDR